MANINGYEVQSPSTGLNPQNRLPTALYLKRVRVRLEVRLEENWGKNGGLRGSTKLDELCISGRLIGSDD